MMMIKGSDTPVVSIYRFLRYFWENWNVQTMVLASLAFQIVLIFAAPSRRKTKGRINGFILWSVYLLADYVATFAIGLINSGSRVDNGATAESKSCPYKHSSIQAVWAPFLLLHLGGPDTITAFAIEDNELWHRHLLSVIVQVLSVVLILYRYQILDRHFRSLLVPTLLVFFAGAIKYAERTCSLYLAALTNMKKSMRQEPDAGLDYAQLMEEYKSKKDAHLPVFIAIEGERVAKSFEAEDRTAPQDSSLRDDLDVIRYGYEFYTIFRGLVVDHMFSFVERNKSRKLFMSLDYRGAFRVMEVELNFIYDAMFTKMYAIYENAHGWWAAVRLVCPALVLASMVLFIIDYNTSRQHVGDVIVTIVLLAGAVILDLAANLELVFSKWTIAKLLNKRTESTDTQAAASIRRRKKLAGVINRVKRLFHRKRWSEKMCQYSLINHSLNKSKRPNWFSRITEKVEATEWIDSCMFTKTLYVETKLKQLIFNEIKKKARQATKTTVAKQISSSKGEWTLLDYSCGPEILSTVSQDVEYDQCVLLWHIATEVFYFTCNNNNNIRRKEGEVSDAEICRYLSEYLLYLLVIETKMTSAVAGIAEIRFRDTCKEAMEFFSKGQEQKKKGCSMSFLWSWCPKKEEWSIYFNSVVSSTLSDIKDFITLSWLRSLWSSSAEEGGRKNKLTIWEKHLNELEDGKRKEACKKLGEVETIVKPSEVKGDRSKALLFEGCMLANNLRDLCDPNKEQGEDGAIYNEDDVWKMMSKVWVELLSYGAGHCRGDAHAQYLGKGGELITFVWLLMAHFGLGDQFRIESGHTRAKLVVGKLEKEVLS